jgi:uncharacterized phage-associated protein
MMSVRFTFQPSKAQAAIAYLAKSGVPELTVYKICKMIFLADKLHLVQVGRTITGDEYLAFDHGPVPTCTYDLLKPGYPGHVAFAEPFLIDSRFKYPRYSLNNAKSIDLDILSKSDIGALDETATRYGQKTFAELRAITHEMPEYRHAWYERRDLNSEKKTELMLFEEFFEQDDDALEGALEEAIENSAIASVSNS